MRVREKGNPLLAPARLVKHGVDVMGDGASMVMAPIAAGMAKGSVAPALSMVFDNIKEAHVDEKYMPRWLLELIDAQLQDVHKESIEGLGDSVKKMLHTTNKERSATGYSVHGWLSRQLDLTEIREVRKFADEKKGPRGGGMASLV